MNHRPPTSQALALALAVVTVGAAASAQPLPPPALATLREAVARAQAATAAQMQRDGEVGAGSETTACMERVTRRRLDAVERLGAVAARAAGPDPAWCALRDEALAQRETLADAGTQAFDVDGATPRRAYLARCRVQAVSAPPAVEAWYRDLAARCGGARPAAPGASRCAVEAPEEFHLRPTATAASTGRALPEGTPLQVLARGALVRRGRAIFRVRVRGEGWEGWTFLPATSVPAGCP